MKWLTNLFKKKNKELEEKEAPVEEGKPREFPEEIEIPWKDAAPVLNLVRLISKTESEFGIFLFQTKKREQAVLKTLNDLDDKVHEKVNELRKENDIPVELEEVNYEFVLPDATGKSGKFVKVAGDDS